MASLPFMPVATDALIGDAGDLPNVLFGAYCRLLFRWWREGAAPEPNEKRLARWSGLTSAEFEDLKEFLTETPDGWIQKRLVETFERVQEKSRKARESANAKKNRANAERTHGETDADAMLTKTKTTSYSKEYSGRAGARKYSNRKKKDVSRETSVPTVLPEEPEARAVAERVIRSIGPPAYASWFTHDGIPLIEKNCKGFILRSPSEMKAEKWRNQYSHALDDAAGKGNWRIEAIKRDVDAKHQGVNDQQ